MQEVLAAMVNEVEGMVATEEGRGRNQHLKIGNKGYMLLIPGFSINSNQQHPLFVTGILAQTNNPEALAGLTCCKVICKISRAAPHPKGSVVYRSLSARLEARLVALTAPSYWEGRGVIEQSKSIGNARLGRTKNLGTVRRQAELGTHHASSLYVPVLTPTQRPPLALPEELNCSPAGGGTARKPDRSCRLEMGEITANSKKPPTHWRY